MWLANDEAIIKKSFNRRGVFEVEKCFVQVKIVECINQSLELKVDAMEAKIKALAVELEKINLEQVMMKHKMERWEQMFEKFILYII